MYRVLVNIVIKNKKGLYLEGQMLLPFKDGLFYKPNNLLITNGFIDIEHIYNKGEVSIGKRSIKDEIIQKYCSIAKGSMLAEVKTPFYIRDGKTIGIVVALSELAGYNVNNNFDIRAKEEVFENKKLGKLFQNLRETKDACKLPIRSIEQVDKECLDEIKLLLSLYERNIKSASDKEKIWEK